MSTLNMLINKYGLDINKEQEESPYKKLRKKIDGQSSITQPFKSPAEPLTPESQRLYNDAMKMQEENKIKNVLGSKLLPISALGGLAEGYTSGYYKPKTPEEQQILNVAKQEHPVISTLANLGGSVASPLWRLAGGATKLLGVAKNVASPILQIAIKEGVTGGIAGAGEGIVRGDNASDIAKRAGEYAALGGGLGAGTKLIGKGINNLSRNLEKDISTNLNNPLEGISKGIDNTSNYDKTYILPKTLNGKLVPKNVQYEKALNEYESAIQTIQNHFGTNDLRVDEVARIKSDLGIDINKLVDNLAKTENKIVDLRSSSAKMKRAAGVASDNQYNLMNNLQKREPIIYGAKNNATESILSPIRNESSIISPIEGKNSSNALNFDNIKKLSDLPQDEVGLKEYLRQAEEIRQKNPLKVELTLFGEAEKRLKERKFASNSILNSQISPEELKQSISKNMPTYEPISNKSTWEKAKSYVDDNFDNALNDFRGIDKLKSADDTALGEALIFKAIKDNNIAEANRLSVDLAEKLTTAGQTVQAAAIFKRLTPEGMIMYAQRTINKANRELVDKYGSNAKKVNWTDEELGQINERMSNVQNMPDGREKDIELAKVQQLISDKIPASISDKFAALQRINLLLNTKTMTRNVLGNIVYGGLSNVKDVVATPIDKVVSLFTKERTATLPSIGTQLKGLKKGFGETIQDYKLGIDTSPSRGQYELPTGRVFKNNTLNKLDQLTRTGLQLGDRPFYQAAYDDALSQQMKLAKTTTATPDMIKNATRVAQERTFQDTNELVNAFKNIQKALNKGGAYFGLGSEKFGVGNVAMPFVKTPVNILKNAVDYSPLSIGKIINQAIKAARSKGEVFNQKEFVDTIAKGVTGTIGLIWTGYELAKRGYLTGQANKDKDAATMKKEVGQNAYALKIGDKYTTYDWAQPTSMPIAFGADMFFGGKDRNGVSKTLMEAINSAGTSLLKQSMFQGVQKLFGGYNPIQNIQDVVLSAGSQFVPLGSTLKQATQFIDNTSRSNYSPSGLEQKLLNPIQQKIPFARSKLEPNISTLGDEQKIYQGNNNIWNVMFNPATSTTSNPTPVQKEILRLHDDSGQTIQFPRIADKTIKVKDKPTYKLTPTEFTQIQRQLGTATNKAFNSIIASQAYKNKKDSEKAILLQKKLTAIKKDVMDEFKTKKRLKED